MHVLIGRGGELAAPFGVEPGQAVATDAVDVVADRPRCPVERITVAEHPDITLAH
jgi:hypothetical protein